MVVDQNLKSSCKKNETTRLYNAEITFIMYPKVNNSDLELIAIRRLVSFFGKDSDIEHARLTTLTILVCTFVYSK